MKKFFSFVAALFVAMTMNAEAISVAAAIEAGMALDSAATSTDDYQIEGYVVDAQTFSLTYNNQIWYMADDAANSASQEFQAYGCVAIDGTDTLQVLNGDKVILTGKLYKYYDKKNAKFVIEVKNGTASFVSKADGDHSINRTTTEVTVAQALEIGATLAVGETTAQQYVITGYVSSMAGKDGDFTSYGNQTYWIADEAGSTANTNALGAFEVYRGVASEEVLEGYKVSVKTAIKRYAEDLIESETKCAVTILEKSAVSVDTVNAAGALAIAEALEAGATSKTYAIVCYVASVKTAYNTEYGNISLWLNDDPTSTYGDILAYRAVMSEAEGTTVGAGDRVLVVGKLTHSTYESEGETKHSYQIVAGAKATILNKTGIEQVRMTEKAQKVMVDGIMYIVRDGKMFNIQGTQVR